MVNLSILAGGYTSFVATYIFNTDTSTLSLASQSNTGVNPSWIAFNPVNKSVLYAVNENTPGALQSFTVNAEGKLSRPLSTVSSNGNSPAFAAPIGSGLVAIMNYGSGNGMIIPTTSPADFASGAGVIQFPALVSHPHMALQVGNEVLVPDLGADKIWRLVQSSAGTPRQWQIQGFIQQPTGSGPRHIAIDGKFLFTLHELSSTLTSQELPAAPNGTSSAITSASIIPPDAPPNTTFNAAEILFPAPNAVFAGRFVYVSNRNTGANLDPRGDTIAIFSVSDNGALALVKHVYTGLQQIRGMQLGGPNSQYLIAGANTAGGVAMFERTGDGGDLALLARNTDLPTRTSFAFFDAAPGGGDEAFVSGAQTKQGNGQELTSAPSTPSSNSSAGTARVWMGAVSAQILLVVAAFAFV